ncbi:MAG: DUF1275 domain-containing protein [Verrucomicrobia bacterium]|nr:DUF1275 domain-containing protein [Verrucomicrobiota bacterium]
MISKLPGWVWFGAAVLSFIAGIVNAVGFLGFQHQGVTHLTGTTTLTGIALAQQDFKGALHLLAIAISFLLGATVSGFIIQGSTLKLGRRYGVALLIESGLLLAAVPLLEHSNLMGDYLASSACGLQNAMASTYSGAVLRTTHVSGVFTDLGIFFGHLLRGMKEDWQRFRLWLVLLGSFLIGGVVGAGMFSKCSYATLYLPAALTGLVGLAYSVYRHYELNRADHQPPDTDP